MSEQPELSKRAHALFERVKQGHYYALDGRPVPKAMAELVEAGLVVRTGRVETLIACYVPAKGYFPYQPESFGEDRTGRAQLLQAAEDLFHALNLKPDARDAVQAHVDALRDAIMVAQVWDQGRGA